MSTHLLNTFRDGDSSTSLLEQTPGPSDAGCDHARICSKVEIGQLMALCAPSMHHSCFYTSTQPHSCRDLPCTEPCQPFCLQQRTARCRAPRATAVRMGRPACWRPSAAMGTWTAPMAATRGTARVSCSLTHLPPLFSCT